MGLPLEIVTWNNNCSAGDIEVGLKISRFSGALNPFMKYIARGSFDDENPFDPDPATDSNSINPDAASAEGALAVAAVDALDPGLDTPQPYSSRGPNTRLFDKDGVRLGSPQVRLKPELAAADGLSTTVPDFEPFFGTSAAVPSAASIAAILRSSNPSASADEIESAMTDPANAIACIEPLTDPVQSCGAGFLLADSAFQALDRDGPVIKPKLTPSKPNGKGGWFTKTVRIAWQVEDPESPVTSQNCPAATQSADGVKTYNCVATSDGGTTSAAVRIKLDTVRPKTPTIQGIRARTYGTRGGKKVPAKKRVKCRSKDRTSGLASCRITGYSRKAGRHTLTARATDRAGLTSVRKLRYRVR